MRKITTMAGAVLAAAVLAATGTALASIPGSDGVIHRPQQSVTAGA